MARLQVVYLPSRLDEPGRFAFVIDGAVDLSPDDREALSAFAVSAGGQGCVVVSGPLDVHRANDDEETTEALGSLLQEVLATPAFPPPATEPKTPKLPPPNTTEGKLARVWGGKPPLEDPR
jgi:hypothetical protein